jgi:hypothetical protein
VSQQSETPLDTRKGVPIRINDVPLVAPEEMMTGAAIAALGDFPAANQLFLELPGPGPDDPVGADRLIRLHAGMKFYDVPVGTFG